MKVNYTEPFNFKPIPCITPMTDYWQNGTWKFGSLEITPDTAYQPSFIDVILKGNTALTLVNAKADGLNYLKLFGGTEQLPETYIDSVTLDGKCEQNGIPTPTVPVDIVCNNGAIKAKRQSGLPLGYQMVEWLIPTGGIIITDFKTKSTQEIETVFYRERSGAAYLYSSDTATSGTTNTTAYLTSGAGNWRWDGKSYSISVSVGIKVTSIQNKDGVWLNDTRLGWYSNAEDFVSTNDLRLSSSENTTIRIYSQTIREGEITTLDLVPVQRLSDSSYGFYDKVSGEFYTSTEATFVAGDPIDDPVEIYTDGTTETATDNLGNVATAQRLLSVGTYKDTQEVLSGSVTRRIGVKVLDGTESWTASGNLFYADIATDALEDTHSCYCTHFKGVATNASATYNNEIKVGTNATASVKWTRVQMYPVVGTYSDVNAFTQWLSDQYNAGTPVIIIYPTSSATTETVTGQFLSKEPVTVTGSLTGLVANVVSSSHTTPTPTKPLPINCNNGVLKVNSQGQIYADGTTETVEVHGKNLFDKNTALLGDISTNGDYVYRTYRVVSDYIPVRFGQTFVGSGTLLDTNGVDYEANVIKAFYKADKSYINGSRGSVTNNKFTINDETCAYIRIVFYNQSLTAGKTVSIENSVLQLEEGETSTPYEPYYNGGSATAEMLLKVGDYQDVQSVLDGVVTRNVGVKVLDGTNVTFTRAADNKFYPVNTSDWATEYRAINADHNKNYIMSNQFASHTWNQDAPASSGWSVSFRKDGANSYIRFLTTGIPTVAEFNTFLANQYNSGNPVVVLYPLATPTTESVTAQPLTIQAGTNIVEITQASIDNLGLEVSYKAGVAVTVTEVENAQLDNSVEVTIA